MEILIIVLILGFIPAMIAKSKGRSFILWYIYGVLLFIIALVHSILIKGNIKKIEEKEMEDGTLKKCQFCAELIKTEATICRFCGKEC